MEHYKILETWEILKVYKKIDKKIIKFVDTEIEKQKFHQHKSPILITNIDINKIVVSNNVVFWWKGFLKFCCLKR